MTCIVFETCCSLNLFAKRYKQAMGYANEYFHWPPKSFLLDFVNDRHACRVDAYYFESKANALFLSLLLQNTKTHSEIKGLS